MPPLSVHGQPVCVRNYQSEIRAIHLQEGRKMPTETIDRYRI
jgi:hypothetical protein